MTKAAVTTAEKVPMIIGASTFLFVFPVQGEEELCDGVQLRLCCGSSDAHDLPEHSEVVLAEDQADVRLAETASE
jgi:hypothetical protein